MPAQSLGEVGPSRAFPIGVYAVYDFGAASSRPVSAPQPGVAAVRAPFTWRNRGHDRDRRGFGRA